VCGHWVCGRCVCGRTARSSPRVKPSQTPPSSFVRTVCVAHTVCLCPLPSTTNACGDDADSCLLPSIPAAVWKPLKDLFTDPTKRIQSLLCVATTVLSGGLWHVMFKLAPYRLMIPLTAAPAILGTSYWVFFKVMAQWDNYQFRTRGRARSREVTPAHDMPHHKETEAGFGEEREPAEREKARDEKKQRSEDMNAAAAGGG